jgi:hypothetical protein
VVIAIVVLVALLPLAAILIAHFGAELLGNAR